MLPSNLVVRIVELQYQNSANIIVQNRMTGQLEEEKMQVYVRLGIRLLYKVCQRICPSCFRYDVCSNRVLKVEWKALEVSLYLFSYLGESLRPGAARSLLKSLSVKQGIKYDSAESAKDIPAFIDFHNLDVKEILEPVDSFSEINGPFKMLHLLTKISETFNQFFYR